MKTILYQPLFINPQAYFVFPQLYHIEKGDSYIEPANITGQLIINDLTKSLTSTPILNVVQDTNQVDFGLFKGKHIRISQYTNIGAVVLGEWYIPGTPTPPEPEQPDWFKESIVAWYSPYCKQRMTNFDVIESYAEDFNSNNWKHTNNVTVTNNSFHLTYGNLTYELYPITTYNTKSMTVIVKGLNGIKGFIRYRYGQKDYVDINKDGIYYLPAKIDDTKVLGFQTHFKSECDITITQLPTSILKDFSGNKHDAYLYGFKGKLNSGVGIYAQDFKNWSYGSTINKDISTKSYNKFHIVKKKADNWFGFTIGIPKNNYYNQSYYPNQLCYDGKSQAVAYGLPILTDYTVIADRTWFAEKVDNGVFMSKALEQNGAFILEYKQGDKWNTYSYYSATNINIDKDNSIVYQTKNKYNEQTIYPGDKQDTDTLFIGTIRKDDSRSFIGCHSDILIFNRTLTEYEISWVKNNMMCSKQQEPDIDL